MSRTKPTPFARLILLVAAVPAVATADVTPPSYTCGPPPAQVMIVIDTGRTAQQADQGPGTSPSVTHRICHCNQDLVYLGTEPCECTPYFQPGDPCPQLNPGLGACARAGREDNALYVADCQKIGAGMFASFNVKFGARIAAPYATDGTTADLYLGYMNPGLVSEWLLGRTVTPNGNLHAFNTAVNFRPATPRYLQLTVEQGLGATEQPVGLRDNGETENVRITVDSGGKVYRVDDGGLQTEIYDCVIP
jgi:hypothetical protein